MKAALGFLGAGAIGHSVAQVFAATGVCDIVISNSRGPDSLSGLGYGMRAGTPEQAAEQDVVFCAVPWSRVPDALGAVPDWSGRTLIDCTNPIEAPRFVKADLGGRTSSEVVADLAPGAHLVKAFNHLAPPTYAAGPPLDGGRRVLFVSGDHDDAKKQVLALIDLIGFVGVDLGALATGGALHEFPGGPLPSRNFIEID